MYYDSGRRKSYYYWIVILVIAVLVFNSSPVKRSRPLNALKRLAVNIIYPFKYLATGTYVNITRGTARFFFLRGVQAENERLKGELADYKTRVILMNQIGAENKRLRELIGFRTAYRVSRIVPVEMIARPATNWFGIIEINKGSRDGISADTAVVNEEGLVGRVLEVSDLSSKVLLITDPSSAVSVYDTETSDMGIANGDLMGPIKIKYLASNANVKPGDAIVTSGMSDTFPKGIIVGRVRSISKKDYDIFQKVDVVPSVNFSRLNKLFVVTK